MKITLTKTERATLLELLHARRQSGEYYGRQDQYVARLNRLIDKLNAQ